MLPAVAEKLGVTLEADSGAAQEPLYQVQPVDKPPVNPIIGGNGALPMQVLANRELQNPETSGRSTRHIEVLLPDGVSYRAGDHLSIVPQNGAALVERAVRRFGFAPGAHVELVAAEGRRASLPTGEAIVGPSPAGRLSRASASRDAQADPGDGAAHALPVHAAQARGAAGGGALQRLRSWPSASRCSTSWRSSGLRAAVRAPSSK